MRFSELGTIMDENQTISIINVDAADDEFITFSTNNHTFIQQGGVYNLKYLHLQTRIIVDDFFQEPNGRYKYSSHIIPTKEGVLYGNL